MCKSYQYKVAGSEPLRNSTTCTLLEVSQTLRRVPLHEAVAINVPCWLMARHASSPWCALIVNGAEEIPASVFDKSYRIYEQSG